MTLAKQPCYLRKRGDDERMHYANDSKDNPFLEIILTHRSFASHTMVRTKSTPFVISAFQNRSATRPFGVACGLES
jgi:hypothetical protein